uniref:Uncharacterized protein n=1 Tax=Octopus bimaculoides TaxID=37653 RepID=A0A0L8GS47_OCTBM
MSCPLVADASLITSKSNGEHHSHVLRGILWGLKKSFLETRVFRSSSLNNLYSGTS